MGATYSAKARPLLRRAHRRRFRRRQALSDTGSTAGMPLFLQRAIPVEGSAIAATATHPEEISQPEEEEVSSNSTANSTANSANSTEPNTEPNIEQNTEPNTEQNIESNSVLPLPNSLPNPLPNPLPNIEGEGEPDTTVAYGNSLRLQGRTDASFSNSFRTQDVVTTAAEGCEGCPANQCVHATGTLVSTFTVTTTVTLPRVADFPSLTACQQQRVQNAIDTVLSPHEQQHVSAFQSYNGTISTPFDLTLCRSRFNAEIRAMHNSVESSQRSAAQGASDALDPFHFDVDLNCSN